MSETTSSPTISDPSQTLANTNNDGEGNKSSWTRILPEAFGIRKAIDESPFRWCVREAALWGVATGTAMGL